MPPCPAEMGTRPDARRAFTILTARVHDGLAADRVSSYYIVRASPTPGPFASRGASCLSATRSSSPRLVSKKSATARLLLGCILGCIDERDYVIRTEAEVSPRRPSILLPIFPVAHFLCDRILSICTAALTTSR